MLKQYRGAEIIQCHIDEQGRIQGEYKWNTAQLKYRCFYVNNIRHGEYMSCYHTGHICWHCFYVDGKDVSFDKIPYPTTPEERMLFMLKYDLQLLPVEIKC